MKIIKSDKISSDLKKKIFEDLDHQSSDDMMGIIIFPSKSTDIDSRNKIIHDLRSSIRTLKNAVENLQDGYQFNDKMASLKIQAIERSVIQLEKHAFVVEEIQKIPG